MKILVTGGAGFIGSHLSEALLAQGDSVIAVDDLSTGNPVNIEHLRGNPNFTFVQGSILDSEKMKRLISSVDGVMHFAAAVGVQKILNDPIGSLRTNVQGSEIVMETAAHFKKPTILASTSEIYGKNLEVPLTEESDRVLGSPLLARWTYSEAKALDESMAFALHRRDGWNVKIIRLFNTVGPRQSASYGMVIPRFIQATLKNESLIIHGDGSQSRVFCHIDDAVAGIMALWSNNAGVGDVFNLGGFEETTIQALAERIIARTNSASTINYIPYGELTKDGFEDIPRRVPSSKKLETLTGWKAMKDLDTIIDNTIREFRKS